jgi:hypothetical protein
MFRPHWVIIISAKQPLSTPNAIEWNIFAPVYTSEATLVHTHKKKPILRNSRPKEKHTPIM